MSFWTGLEALSGHRPGAFTGFSMKDLFEKDMWDRLPRTWSGKMGTPEHLKANPMDQRLSRGGEPMMTNWYNRNAGTAAPVPVNEWVNPNTQASPVQMNQLGTAQAQTRPLAPRPELNPVNLQPFVPGVSPTQGLESIRQWGGGNPNTRGMMWGDPTFSGIPGQLGTRWGAGLGAPTATPPMLDKTTVVTESADPNQFSTKKTTYKQQVPANPTNTLMNMGRKFISGYQDLARRRLEEEMLRRQRGY